MRPLIGITTYVEPAQWGAWELPSALIPYMYVQAIERAGGRALLVPPSTAAIEETLDALDGLLFSGGSDLDPATYDRTRTPRRPGLAPNATGASSRSSAPRSRATCRCSPCAAARRC